MGFVVVTMAVPTQLGDRAAVHPDGEARAGSTALGGVAAELVTAFGVFFMRQYLVDAVPDELIEAARMDGCAMIRTFWTVAVPAARPAMAILFLFTFMMVWTDYMWPLIVLPSDNPDAADRPHRLQSGYSKDYALVLAGAGLATIPLLVLFVVAGRSWSPASCKERSRDDRPTRPRRPPPPPAERAFPDRLPLGSRHGVVPDRGRRHRRRPHAVDLGHVLPGARRRHRWRHRRRRVRPLPPDARRRRADGVAQPRRLPLLGRLAAGAARRRRGQPGRASTSTRVWSTSCSPPASRPG